MAHLSSSTTRYVSLISLVLLFLAQIVGSILFLSTRFYQLTYRGCYNTYTTIPAELPWIWITVASFCFQILLLALFLYPLIRHKSMSNSTTSFRTFLPVIQRAMVTSLICVATDLVSSLLILLVADDDEIIPTLAYDVSLVTNVVCVVFSFSDWRSRFLAPFYSRCFNRKRNGEPSFIGKMESLKTNNGDTHQTPLSSPNNFARCTRTRPNAKFIVSAFAPEHLAHETSSASPTTSNPRLKVRICESYSVT